MLKQVVKAPASVLDVGVVWSEWLNTEDTIVASVWTSDSTDLTVDRGTNDTTSTRAFVSGGVDGKLYKVFNRITTAAGLVDERYIQVYIQSQSV